MVIPLGSQPRLYDRLHLMRGNVILHECREQACRMERNFMVIPSRWNSNRPDQLAICVLHVGQFLPSGGLERQRLPVERLSLVVE